MDAYLSLADTQSCRWQLLLGVARTRQVLQEDANWVLENNSL
jgi:hypothetical protein